MFGYARHWVGGFLERHWNDPAVRADVHQLETEHAKEQSGDPARWQDDPASVADYVYWLMDQDRKSTGLKSLQGKIWDEGYRSGELRGEVYPDVPVAFERWRRQELDIAIFSSGSVQAQRLLFHSTAAGDLTRFIRAYFDTTTGPKTTAESYARIAAALQRPPSEVLFVSDITAELDAARSGGMQT
ncbi:MAG TPA: acireductone synthase, partial [Gemmatimonadales bacterium]